MLLSEVCKVKGITDGNPPEYDWEKYLNETARLILEQQTPNQLLLVRGRLYELLVRLIPTHVIFHVRNCLKIWKNLKLRNRWSSLWESYIFIKIIEKKTNSKFSNFDISRSLWTILNLKPVLKSVKDERSFDTQFIVCI